jgi:5-(carboxyamino)imidazole ribonucleotide synthase
MLVGVLGAGQLGRMLALAGLPLDMRFRFLDPDPDAPGAAVGEHILGSFTDAAAVARFADGLDVATFEFENVPVSCVESLAGLRVWPSAFALNVAQDRVSEKKFFQKAQLAVHPYAPVDDLASLCRALGKEVGIPAVLKTRRGGYDGKGQAVIRSIDDAERAWDAIGQRPAIVESLVPFSRELSVVAVRGIDGSFRAYPIVENHHKGGILRTSIAPATGVPMDIEQAANDHCRALMEAMSYVGVLAVEFFEHNGSLLANEMAPRVHNSGHWTIEGAATSQFENHLRAIAGLPLGGTSPRGHSVMLNLIGGSPDPAAILAIPGAHLHLYGKASRPGRKIGHVTVVDNDPAKAAATAARVREIIQPFQA